MPREWSGDDTTPVRGRVGVVVSKYNDNITRRLLTGALDTLKQASIADDAIDVCWVPGAWEIPLVARELARDRRYAALVCLGAVIRGETTHDEHINRQVSLSLGQIALDANLPVAFGVLTCNSLEQALQRAGGTVGNKGQEAAAAALEMARLLSRIRAEGSGGVVEHAGTPGGTSGAGEGNTARSGAGIPVPSYRSERRPPRPGDPSAADRGPRPLFSTPPERAKASPGEALKLPASDGLAPPTGAVGNAAAGRSKGASRGPRVRRRRAREVVLQMLYADDVNPGRNMSDADLFLRRRLSFDSTMIKFASELLAGVRKHRGELDQLLARQATNWSLQRMAVTDRNVLRMGAYEILHTDTPRVVVINEAVELARRYGSRQSSQFVNGILDRFNAERRPAPAE